MLCQEQTMRRNPVLFALLLAVLCTQSVAWGAELLGRLSDDHGHALSNSYVHAWMWTETNLLDFDTTTDESGAFSFSGDSGSWYFEVPPEQLNSRGYFDKRVKVSHASKRYFRFIASGQPASRSAKAR